tara:strand:- start:258 stop:380 length:123 start_codon:yes stop_codon:yes gene_type:complete
MVETEELLYLDGFSGADPSPGSGKHPLKINSTGLQHHHIC